MARPKGFTDKELEAAQSKLYDLCKQYDIQPFEIKHTGADSKKWLALVLHMCGLNVPDPKRGAKEDKSTHELGSHAYLLLDFWHTDEKTGKPLTKEAIYREVVKAKKLASKDKPGGRRTRPENTVKKALAKVMKERQKTPKNK